MKEQRGRKRALILALLLAAFLPLLSACGAEGEGDVMIDLADSMILPEETKLKLEEVAVDEDPSFAVSADSGNVIVISLVILTALVFLLFLFSRFRKEQHSSRKVESVRLFKAISFKRGRAHRKSHGA